MAITIHFLLLASVLVFTTACLVARPGRAKRSLGTVLLAFLPFWVIGITGSLLLSANGVPTVEWIIPGIATLLISVACRSDTLFAFARWGLLVASVLLCADFLALTYQDYTASGRTQGAASNVQRAAVRNVAKGLRTTYPPEAILPAGEVGKVTVMSVVSEWHTPLTRLYRIDRQQAVVWYPGGNVGEAAGKLSLKLLEKS